MDHDADGRPDQSSSGGGSPSEEGLAPGQDAERRPAARDGEPNTALPPKVEAWRRRSAAGAILTGFALGLQEALEAPRQEPSIMMETSGDPPQDLPVEADFEYGRPRHSVVSIRPWLLAEQSPGEAEGRPRAEGPEEAGGAAGDA